MPTECRDPQDQELVLHMAELIANAMHAVRLHSTLMPSPLLVQLIQLAFESNAFTSEPLETNTDMIVTKVCHEPTRRTVANAIIGPCDSIHQTGTKYRSNNAGDGPEKTRDRKNWFPRFKSNWLGTYRSKEMFACCECALAELKNARYKGAEAKHCKCGKDQWHLAKMVEETEYNRRMDISKSFGGLKYDEAMLRMRGEAGSAEHQVNDDRKRIRCESAESTDGEFTDSSFGDSPIRDMKRVRGDTIKVEQSILELEPIRIPEDTNKQYWEACMNHYSPASSTLPSNEYGGFGISVSRPVDSTFVRGDCMKAYQCKTESPYTPLGEYTSPTTLDQLAPVGAEGECMANMFGGLFEAEMIAMGLTSSVAPLTLPPPPVGDVDFEIVHSPHGDELKVLGFQAPVHPVTDGSCCLSTAHPAIQAHNQRSSSQGSSSLATIV
ncbi:TPA: hypothetical protein N0F65_013009 [Lagenidium giganteum]|uniref:Uncharacterized protein n=1 Tax=Lagenidium giganteum TaxID=4803 RepID=A0AAV2YN86_9STRA|nr:TPA: hypothetical protein N0F65_013009 [Lagenidium giganteum]